MLAPFVAAVGFGSAYDIAEGARFSLVADFCKTGIRLGGDKKPMAMGKNPPFPFSLVSYNILPRVLETEGGTPDLQRSDSSQFNPLSLAVYRKYIKHTLNTDNKLLSNARVPALVRLTTIPTTTPSEAKSE